ncbi:FliI/YscN family ATPase [Geminicoccus flavidas]|uniref:FliI/YscN family ATPase n=1 Tax=Geminicoccus flavidas TaxID=2506407 RepID=UPI0038B2C469
MSSVKKYNHIEYAAINLNRIVASHAGHVESLLTRLAERRKPILGGRVRRCWSGSLLVEGLNDRVGIGDVCRIEQRARPAGMFVPEDTILAEVVGFGVDGVQMIAFEEVNGVRYGARVRPDQALGLVHPARSWLGRVVDPMGMPLDGGGPLEQGPVAYPLQARAEAALARRPIGRRLDLGVRAMNLFTPCCEGQRLGIFAGSGVGKSTLLSMIARHSDADALVIGLIGERGREVGEFLEHTLGAEGRRRSVLIAATSDLPAMLRRRAAYLTMAVAEALRDQGLNVLCLIDSVTRFAMALREIYLAAGEGPATRGYPPSVFAELPRLLERAGPGSGAGSITGLFSVLVDGDDDDEPVSDTVRGILDGHVMLARNIAEAGRFPAIDVLRSVSRTAPGCYRPDERELVGQGRELMRRYADMAELIQLGAYRQGTDADIDEAILRRPALEALLRQEVDEPWWPGNEFTTLARALGHGLPIPAAA